MKLGKTAITQQFSYCQSATNQYELINEKKKAKKGKKYKNSGTLTINSIRYWMANPMIAVYFRFFSSLRYAMLLIHFHCREQREAKKKVLCFSGLATRAYPPPPRGQWPHFLGNFFRDSIFFLSCRTLTPHPPSQWPGH